MENVLTERDVKKLNKLSYAFAKKMEQVSGEEKEVLLNKLSKRLQNISEEIEYYNTLKQKLEENAEKGIVFSDEQIQGLISVTGIACATVGCVIAGVSTGGAVMDIIGGGVAGAMVSIFASLIAYSGLQSKMLSNIVNKAKQKIANIKTKRLTKEQEQLKSFIKSVEAKTSEVEVEAVK